MKTPGWTQPVLFLVFEKVTMGYFICCLPRFCGRVIEEYLNDGNSKMRFKKSNDFLFQNEVTGKHDLNKKNSDFKCAKSELVQKLLNSNNENYIEIAECIILSECELAVGRSKIERAIARSNKKVSHSVLKTELKEFHELMTSALEIIRSIN